MKLLDTCFLIDLQREARRKIEGPAQAFLRRNLEETFAVSPVVCCEFLEGFEVPEEGEVYLADFPLLAVDGAVARQAARIRRNLRLSGSLIGDFDILIAATAFRHRIPLVTDNADHFGRISGVKVENYR